MRTRNRIALSLVAAAVAAAVAGAAPAASASARPVAQPLVDAAPLGSKFRDRVTHGRRDAARAAAARFRPFTSPDGYRVEVAISDEYGDAVPDTVPQSYVDFLASLVHGPELGRLRVLIAPPAEVQSECGGLAGTLACYDSAPKVMTVPGEAVASSGGVTTSYVVAHEYGHHIAATRDNAPFSAFRTGPKFWSSHHLVCNRTIAGLLAPGDEGERYLSNPGEAWAETYAQLAYPEVDWQYTDLLAPDDGSFAAARADVLQPWEHAETKVFRSRFRRGGGNTQRFRFDLSLDGSLSASLIGPRRANYDLSIRSGSKHQGSSQRSGSRERLSYEAACRTRNVEHVTVTVSRVRGAGPFTLRLKYAG